MKHLRRWLFIWIVILSLLSGMMASILGVSSNWYMIQSRMAGTTDYMEILSASGVVTFYSESQDANYPVHSFARIDRVPPNPWPGQFQWKTLGFDRSIGFSHVNAPFTTYTVPYWPLALIGIGWPTWRMIRQARIRRRFVAGRCTSCGYDLRATPDRCPECGTVSQKMRLA